VPPNRGDQWDGLAEGFTSGSGAAPTDILLADSPNGFNKC